MFRFFVIFVLLFFIYQVSIAETFREKIRERIKKRYVQQVQDEMLENDGDCGYHFPLPAGVRVDRDIAYGSDKNQKFDVYIPVQAKVAPVIFMVHGGAWRMGDKAIQRVVKNKVARWVPKGFIFISINYRLLPDAGPLEQARDVVRAVSVAQDKAESWGGDSSKFILMGHSAGAHLVALLATDRALSAGIVKKPWLGTVALDSAAYDVVKIMEKRHFPLYDKAFGSDKQYWKAASPFYSLTKETMPILAVCSSRRDDSTAQARQFAKKAGSLGVVVDVLEKDLSHSEINFLLGEDKVYTEEVEAFMASLNELVENMLLE
jgi:acetyl esterase/lipase